MLSAVDDGVEVTFEGPAKFGVERYDRVLVSVGRRPSSQDLGLEKILADIQALRDDEKVREHASAELQAAEAASGRFASSAGSSKRYSSKRGPGLSVARRASLILSSTG